MMVPADVRVGRIDEDHDLALEALRDASKVADVRVAVDQLHLLQCFAIPFCLGVNIH